MPVTSYAPEFLELFRRAAQAPVTLTLPGKADATKMRARLHALRRVMRQESHSLTTIANGVQISIYPDPAGSGAYKLTASPADNIYLNALHAAGIDIPEPGLADTFAPEVEPVGVSGQDEVLESFFRGEKKT